MPRELFALVFVASLLPLPGAAEPDSAVFSDGSQAPIRRVYTWRQDDGVPAFSDRAPADQPWEMLAFACYACDPGSTIDWHSIPLHRDEYSTEIAAAARAYDVDDALIRALIHAESNFNPNALSRRGAQGLMQLMPATATMLGVENPFEAAANVDGGVRYLAGLLARYRGDVRLATAAYNAGPTRVDQHGDVPPLAETRTYVDRVRILFDRYRNADQT